MKTYQDLLECGQDENARISFILSAIEEHKASSLYRTAVDAKLYYGGENPTINRYEKILYDMQGKAHRDMWTANHKIASSFFKLVVKQEYNYLLGNGVTFGKETNKNKLGRDFDIQVSKAAEYALIGGVSFGFWDLDHVQVFEATEFVPLYDEENGALATGIRFWQINDGKPLRCTLYELDGFTEYIKRRGEDLEELAPKRKYIIHATGSKLESGKIYEGENYPDFPIVPLKNNRDCRSELCGKRNIIDALDLCTSNMVNSVDEGNIIYWALQNCGGMDEMDAAKFLERVKMNHIAFMDSAGEGASIEPHTIEAPYVGTQAAIEMLEKKLYKDFMALDTSDDALNAPTATGLKFRYANLDLKTDDFERQVTEFVLGILKLAGIDDSPTYTRNQIINRQEEMQSILMVAPYVTREYLTRKLLTILGDADMVEEILKQLDAEDLGRFDGNNPQDGGNEPEEEQPGEE